MNNYLDYYILAKNEYYNYIKDSSLFAPINYILDNGGKYLRPNLVFASCDYFNVNLDDVKHIALAIELVHTYSLIHDDLPCMDNDDYRRGKLTLHKKFNYAIATLSGDALLSDAFFMINKCNLSSDIKLKIICMLSECIGSLGMVDGQVLDINNNLNTVDDIINMYKKKTGKLFAFALSIPCIILNNHNFELYYELGEILGVCFQLKDDLDEYRENKKESYLINKYHYNYVNDLYEKYKLYSNDIFNRLNIDKNSSLFNLLVKIRG